MILRLCFECISMTMRLEMTNEFELAIEVDTGLWLMPAQYKRIARAGGNVQSML
ncbi:hypothetical protein [Mucilaginibacter sp.]